MSHASLTPAKHAAQTKTTTEHSTDLPDATLGDLFRVADALGVSAADIVRLGSANA